MGCTTCLRKTCISKELQVAIIKDAVLTLLAILACGSDWYLYCSISKIEKGLVYGPLPCWKKDGFLAWSILGSLFALAKTGTMMKIYICQTERKSESTRAIKDMKSMSEHMDAIKDKSGELEYPDADTRRKPEHADAVKDMKGKQNTIKYTRKVYIIMSLGLASDVIYQLPKATFKLLIILCREIGFNVLICVTSFIDFMSSVVPFFYYMWKCRNEDDVNKDEICLKRKKLSIGGIVCAVSNFAITITVIIYSFHFRNPDGDIILSRYRFNWYGKTYDMDCYFKNVGVYFAPPKLDDDWNYNFSDVDWIKLYPFYDDIFDRKIGLSSPDCFPSKTITHKIHFYEDRGTPISYFKITQSGTDKVEHFKVNKSAGEIEEISEFSEIKQYYSYTIIVKSEYISPDDSISRVFGSIRFNWRTLWPSGNCTRPNITIRNDDYKTTTEANSTAIIQYFRQNNGISSSSYFLKKRRNELQFYDPKTDLEDIKKLWRPGLTECSCTGDVAPVFDEGFDIDCT